MSKPFISIVIPTWRQNKILFRCLDSLYTQDYPKNKYEIILIRTKSLDTHHTRVKTIKIPKGTNHAEARNIGVSASKGSIVAFCDDDCILPTNWLTSGVSYFKNKKIDLVGGPVLPPPNQPFKFRLGGYLSGSRFTVGYAAPKFRTLFSEKEANEYDLILANNFVRKEAFNKCQGFNINQVPCEENSLYVKLLNKGYTLFYSPKIACTHPAKPIFLPLAKRVHFYATGRGLLLARVPKTFNLQYFIPSLFMLSIPLLIILYYIQLISLSALLIYGSFYLILNLLNSLYIFYKFERNPLIFLAAPLATFLVHMAYGLGFINGLLLYALGKRGAYLMPKQFK